MSPRLAYRPQSSPRAATGAQTAGAARAVQIAEALSWAAMVLGLATASLLLVQSYLLGG